MQLTDASTSIGPSAGPETGVGRRRSRLVAAPRDSRQVPRYRGCAMNPTVAQTYFWYFWQSEASGGGRDAFGLI